MSSRKQLLLLVFVVFFIAQLPNKIFGDPLFCNEGISFGFQFKSPVLLLLLAIGAIVPMAFLWKVRPSEEKASLKILIFGESLLIGGAASNFFDRLHFGCIPDFFQVVSFFPAFNIADVGISLGAVLIFFSLVKKNTEK